MLSLGHKLNKDLNVYVRYAEGFKSGGFNGEAQSVAEVKTPYLPEKLKSVELGMKALFDENRVQLNVAVFNNKTTDLQQPIFTAKGSVAARMGEVTTVDANLAMGRLDLDKLMPAKAATPEAAPAASVDTPAAPGTFSLPTGINANATVTIDQVVVQGNAIDQVKVVAALADAPVADLTAAVVEVQEESEREGLRQLEAHPHSPLGVPYCRQPATRPD